MNKARMTTLATLAGVASVGAALLLAARSREPVRNPHVPEPDKDVELDPYLGRWYEMARYENHFEQGSDAVTAEYSLRPDGLIDIVNRAGRDATGKPRISRGKARVVPDSRNAKFKVSFFGPFYVGDYWILDHAEDYSWSIVGEPSGRYLWILTRARDPEPALRSQLLHRVAELGYDVDALRMTEHTMLQEAPAPAAPA